MDCRLIYRPYYCCIKSIRDSVSVPDVEKSKFGIMNRRLTDGSYYWIVECDGFEDFEE